VRQLALSSDGSVLASGDYSGELKLWDLSSYTYVRDHIVELSCERAGRSFSQEEWTRHVGSNFDYQQTCP
jgi:WD40 repeat protein